MKIRSRFLFILLITSVILVGCGKSGGIGEISPNTLTVLAGSELKDLEPLLADIEKNSGYRLAMRYVGTLDGAEMLMSGEKTDLAWFSHVKYISLLPDANNRIVAQEKIMLSPVVLGVKESKAQAWGWMNNSDLTWRDIENKASSNELHYAMTNPTSSNSGFSALVGVAAALSGSGEALQTKDINNEELQKFFQGQTLTAGSSGWLADSYIKEQDRLEGIINYESVLLRLNDGGQLKEKLHLVYPKEGIITADYPLMLINGEKRQAYDKVVAYLRSPDFQKKLMDTTLNRPIVPQVKLSDKFSTQMLVELPFPSSLEVVDTILFSYLDKQRIPAHAFFVLDVSGSMRGNGLDQLKVALNNLTGEDQSLTGQFARFRDRERITLIPFNDKVLETRDFQIQGVDTKGQSMAEIRDYVTNLQANGGTAIYWSLAQAYQLAAEAKQKDPNRYYSIVLMSDGENTDGINQDQFLNIYRKLPEDVRNIKTFTILFGNADVDTMTKIAQATGGQVFDGQKQSLNFIFKQIRGYQ